MPSQERSEHGSNTKLSSVSVSRFINDLVALDHRYMVQMKEEMTINIVVSA